jgi:hypothetical protein
MSTVPTVHEDVQQRASKNEQVRQKAERMGAVLGKKKETGDDRKPSERQSRPGFPEAARLRMFVVLRSLSTRRRRVWQMVGMLVGRHGLRLHQSNYFIQPDRIGR